MAELDLFTSVSDAIGETEEEHRERIARLKERLQKIAAELLDEDFVRRGNGIAFVDVRFAAETRGLLTGEEKGRTLSFGSTLMESAGGAPYGWKRSKHRNSNRRLVRTFKKLPHDVPPLP